MEQPFHDAAGGIVGLQRFVEEHAGALNYELIRIGLRLYDIGEKLTWPDLRDFIAGLPLDSALHRELHPKSWWWTPDIDFMAAIVTTLQLANWQRSGGKGQRPQPITKPRDTGRNAPKTMDEARARKKAQRDELARRAERNGGR